MKKIKPILLVLLLAFASCNNGDDDCNLLCFTPPNDFRFEIVDKTSGENLFTNGTYESREIKIANSLDNNSPTKFTFISDNNINLISVGSIGWKTEIVNLKFNIADNHIFDFYVEAERKAGECCEHTEYNKIEIVGAEFELDSQTGIYKIFVE